MTEANPNQSKLDGDLVSLVCKGCIYNFHLVSPISGDLVAWICSSTLTGHPTSAKELRSFVEQEGKCPTKIDKE